ncbi:MAG: hypothetical protein R3300_17085 [Candidatus Promineifilaceae bacterium]|nr:hypothetical protein [Candidatus Promineifilaceae bacterium]
MDGFYYAANGRRLIEGHGFTEVVIWQFLDQPTSLPTPSHTYWQPLPSLLAAAGYGLRADFRGEQLLFWLMSGLLPLLAYFISKLLSGERWQAWMAALLTAVGGFYGPFLLQPSPFAPYAWFGAGAVLVLTVASSDRWLSPLPLLVTPRHRKLGLWGVGGFLAGLAHLTRADGVLLLVVGTALWSWLRWTARQPKEPAAKLSHLVLFVMAYLAVMGPWLVRNWAVTDQPFSAGAAQGLFLTNYDDLFAYGRSFSLATYVEWGVTNILLSKLAAFNHGIVTLLAVTGLVFLAPLILYAWVWLWRRPGSRALLRPLTLYIVVLLLALSVLFTFAAQRGSFFQSSVALWPWAMALAPVGLGLVIDRIAARFSHWQPQQAKPRFAALFVLMALAVSLAVGRFEPLPGQEPATYRRIDQLLPSGEVVMIGNPPAFHYFTGRPAIAVPNEPLPIVRQAAVSFDVGYLVLNEHHPLPLTGLYLGSDPGSGLELMETIDSTKIYRFVESAGP